MGISTLCQSPLLYATVVHGRSANRAPKCPHARLVVAKRWRGSPLKQPHNFGSRERIEMQIETDDGRRCVGLHLELVGLYGKHSEHIAVRMVALGRTGSAIAGCAIICACLQRGCR